MSICPVTPLEQAKKAQRLIEEQQQDFGRRVDLVSARLFGLQRQLEDIPIHRLGEHTKTIADVVIDLEALRIELPELLGTPVA